MKLEDALFPALSYDRSERRKELPFPASRCICQFVISCSAPVNRIFLAAAESPCK